MSALLDSDYGLSLPTRGNPRRRRARITPNEIWWIVGAKSEGVITGRELDSLDETTRKALSVGQKILIYVMDPKTQTATSCCRSPAPARSRTGVMRKPCWPRRTSIAARSRLQTRRPDRQARQRARLRARLQLAVAPPRSEGDTPEQKWARMSASPMQVKGHRVDRGRNRLILSERAAAKESREAQKTAAHRDQAGDVRTATSSAWPSSAPLWISAAPMVWCTCPNCRGNTSPTQRGAARRPGSRSHRTQRRPRTQAHRPVAQAPRRRSLDPDPAQNTRSASSYRHHHQAGQVRALSRAWTAKTRSEGLIHVSRLSDGTSNTRAKWSMKARRSPCASSRSSPTSPYGPQPETGSLRPNMRYRLGTGRRHHTRQWTMLTERESYRTKPGAIDTSTAAGAFLTE